MSNTCCIMGDVQLLAASNIRIRASSYSAVQDSQDFGPSIHRWSTSAPAIQSYAALASTKALDNSSCLESGFCISINHLQAFDERVSIGNNHLRRIRRFPHFAIPARNSPSCIGDSLPAAVVSATNKELSFSPKRNTHNGTPIGQRSFVENPTALPISNEICWSKS